MSSPVVAGFSNGHLSPDNAMPSNTNAETSEADTDVSHAHHSPMTHSSPAESEIIARETPDHADLDEGYLDSDAYSVANASDDADSDVREQSAASHQDDDGESEPEADHEPDASPGSSRASKRKAEVAEDTFIKANPELYGLRRSVSCAVSLP